MADINIFASFTRSNYFRVHDVADFKQFCEHWDLGYMETVVNGEMLVGFISNGWPDETDGVFLDSLRQEQLLPGSVAIVIESGFEIPYRNIVWMAAFTTEKLKIFSIEDFYAKASELGELLTRCEV